MRVPSVIGRRAVAAAVAFALVAVAVTGVWAYRRHRAGTVDDAAAVWCLAADRRPALVQAAHALGVVRPESTAERLDWPGGSGGAERWRGERPADFARTCRALLGAEQRPSGGGSSPWSGFTPALLLAVVSAALAAWFSRRSAAADARRVEAEALRAAARAYRAAVERLLRELEQRRPGMAPDDGEVQDRRLELATRLRAAATAYRHWSLPRTLGETLDREPLGAGMTARWTARSPQERPGWVAETRVALGRLEAEVAQVAEAMQEPRFRTRTPAGRR
ncbi:hypothetical protein GA0070618_1010 [Micromonospora echinospora]|uniref:Uncharacterized protein n=1 Tax=Micromonospora echinospora TaxID=1877 RepID=A0A1C4V6X9_MICEC|nr:hypothetical protein [Micromonospora echinospora]SCE79803.1 hypothetical protein GA0070618_1010 [Micromonospora echinospora]